MAADVRWLGPLRLPPLGRRRGRARRPVPDRQPEGGGDRRRDPGRRHPAHPRARRPPRRHGRHRQAHRRDGRRDRRARDRDRERRRRGRARPQPRRHRHVRLGLGQARARLAHRGLAERHRAHARRPADPLRRPARSTTWATPRCSATCSSIAPPRRQGGSRARADRRPLHDGPLRRRHRGRVDQPVPGRSRSTTARSRPSRPTPGVQVRRRERRLLAGAVLDPGDTHTLR